MALGEASKELPRASVAHSCHHLNKLDEASVHTKDMIRLLGRNEPVSGDESERGGAPVSSMTEGMEGERQLHLERAYIETKWKEAPLFEEHLGEDHLTVEKEIPGCRQKKENLKTDSL